MSVLTYVDGSGVLRDVSSAQPLPTTGTGSGPSVGLTGSTAPTSADEIGWVDGSGNLVNVSAATPLPVAATVSAEEIVLNVTGSTSSAAVLTNFPITTTGYRTASVQVTNAGSSCTLIAEQSNDGTTWYGIQTPTDLVAEAATPLTVVGLYNFPVSAKQFRMRCSVYGSGTPAVNVQFRLAEIDYALQSTALGASSAVIGHVIVDSGTLAATQSGTWTVQPGNTANTTAWKVDGSAVTQPVSSLDTRPASGNITIVDSGSSTTTGFQSASIITGSPSANSTYTQALNGMNAVDFQVSGTWTGTLQFEISMDGGTTYEILVVRVFGSVYISGTTTGNGIFIGNCAGATHVRVRATAAMTGTAVCLATISYHPSAVYVTHPTRLVDNASGNLAVIKNASTAAGATDTALVVAVSPNNTVAVTQSGAWSLSANQSTNISQVNGTTVLVNTGAVGTGSARVAVGTDTATVAGSAPGSAGSPNVYVGVSGAAASGASVAGNPLLSGARAATTNPTAVTDGQAVALMADKLGKLVAVGAVRILKGTQKATLSNTTSETTIVTQVASTFLDLYGLILAISGASTTKVDIRDTTGGSIIATIEVPTLETRGFMLEVSSAIPQTTVNTNWTAQCTTATTALEVTALYVKNI
jgi:hypothetical protein